MALAFRDHFNGTVRRHTFATFELFLSSVLSSAARCVQSARSPLFRHLVPKPARAEKSKFTFNNTEKLNSFTFQIDVG